MGAATTARTGKREERKKKEKGRPKGGSIFGNAGAWGVWRWLCCLLALPCLSCSPSMPRISLLPLAGNETFLIHFQPPSIHGLRVHTSQSVSFNCTQVQRHWHNSQSQSHSKLPPPPSQKRRQRREPTSRSGSQSGGGTGGITQRYPPARPPSLHSSLTTSSPLRTTTASATVPDRYNYYYDNANQRRYDYQHAQLYGNNTNNDDDDEGGGESSLTTPAVWGQQYHPPQQLQQREEQIGDAKPTYWAMIFSSDDQIARPVWASASSHEDGSTTKLNAAPKAETSTTTLNPNHAPTPLFGSSSHSGESSTTVGKGERGGGARGGGGGGENSRTESFGHPLPLVQQFGESSSHPRFLLMAVQEGQQHNFSIQALHVGRVTMSVAVVGGHEAALLADNGGQLPPDHPQYPNNVIQAVATSHFPVTTVRGQRTADVVFDSSAAAIAILITFGMGCCTDTDSVKRQLKFPVSLIIGFCCQFILMPVADGWGKETEINHFHNILFKWPNLCVSRSSVLLVTMQKTSVDSPLVKNPLLDKR